MTYTLQFLPRAMRELSRLPHTVQKTLGRRIDSLARNTFPPGVKKLVGYTGDFYRLRVGDYRVIYQVQGEILVVLIVSIGHRKEVYKRLPR